MQVDQDESGIGALAEQVIAEAPEGQSEESALAVKRALDQLQAKAKKAKTSSNAVVSPSVPPTVLASGAEQQQRG